MYAPIYAKTKTEHCYLVYAWKVNSFLKALTYNKFSIKMFLVLPPFTKNVLFNETNRTKYVKLDAMI